MRKENLYAKMKEKHREEVNKFPMKFAITDEDLIEGMKELGLEENDKDKITAIGGGGFIRDADIKAYNEMFNRHHKEMQEEIKKDSTGENFIRDMFAEELANYEYGYTNDIGPALRALGLTINDIEKNEGLKRGLELATKPYMEEIQEEEDEL